MAAGNKAEGAAGSPFAPDSHGPTLYVVICAHRSIYNNVLCIFFQHLKVYEMTVPSDVPLHQKYIHFGYKISLYFETLWKEFLNLNRHVEESARQQQ